MGNGVHNRVCEHGSVPLSPWCKEMESEAGRTDGAGRGGRADRAGAGVTGVCVYTDVSRGLYFL